MKKITAEFIIILILLFSLPGTVSAGDYNSAWGNGLNNADVEAMASLKSAAAAICDETDSDYEKVRKLNQYICDNTDYDYSNQYGGLAAFVNQDKVICSGYAEALAYLLDCVNVKNFTVTDYVSSRSSTVLHIWNAVYIEGEWFHVDPTWNDATRNRSCPNGRYFLLTVDEISLDRQTISLNTEEDYNDFYKFIKTITLSLETTDMERCSVQGSRIFVPLYETAYALGGYVKQDDNGEITIILDTKTLNLTIGSQQGFMDGVEFYMDAAPQIIDGTIMVPVRLVFEKLGAAVSYDSISSFMTIDYDPYQTK